MKNRVDFIDWLKAVGMFLIVFGHYFGEPYNQFTQPIYPKQLGVAFFVFVMGWGLARESRPHWQVVYNRLFPMYFWGFGIAVFLSLLFFVFQSRLLLSNYFPFVAGLNVFANSFPANPTTWFIGTYLHILLFWAVLLRKVPITKSIIFMVLIAEWLIRAFWIGFEHLFTGYMLISNWITILLLGMYMWQQNDNHNVTKALVVLTGWAIVLFAWASLVNQVDLTQSFPFKTLPNWGAIQNGLTISAAISFVYIANTLMAVKFFSLVPANKIVRFFSRNTIIVFIGHMPLYDVAEPIARIFVEQGWGKRAIIVLIMYVGLAIVSEMLHKLLDLNTYKTMLWQRLLR
jgi:hypothetical protein